MCIRDSIHSHDWHTALVTILFKRYYQWKSEFSKTKAIFTIHNIQYQGIYDKAILGDVFGLGEGDAGTVCFNGCINLMKGAIVSADKVNTVSPTYARELTYPYYAHGLSAIIREYQYKFCGILNGIDNDRVNPETNPNLYQNFNYRSPAKMAYNKRKLQEEMGFAVDDKIPIVAIISRLVSHKGLDLVKGVFNQLMELPLQMVILGTGDREYEDFFRFAASGRKGKLEVRIAFDGALADRIYGGADIILMPSKSEPCGLVQMIALRYGTCLLYTSMLDYDKHAKTQNYVKELNYFYLENPALWERDCDPEGFKWIVGDDNKQNILVYSRISEKEELIVAVNFSPVTRENYTFGLPHEGVYEEIFSSESEDFGGSGILAGNIIAVRKPRHGMKFSGSVKIPAFSFTVWKRKTRKIRDNGIHFGRD